MGHILAGDVLQDISYALVELVVNTTLGTAVSPGIQTVTPASMVGIYEGAMLVVGAGVSQEVVLVISTTDSTFSAQFVNNHLSTDAVVAATFPSGQTDHPLFTQDEILGYMAQSQSDFILKVRMIYAIATQLLTVGKMIYPYPLDAVRLERISVNSCELYDTTQTDLDWIQGIWGTKTSPSTPRYWYQDKVGAANFGVGPPPQVQNTARIFYSKDALSLVVSSVSITGGVATITFSDKSIILPVGQGVVVQGNALSQANSSFEVTSSSPGVAVANTGGGNGSGAGGVGYPANPILGLLSTLLLPDVMTQYIKYGALAMCFSKDGEQRDQNRAKYCQGRFDMGVMIAAKFMKGVQARFTSPEETVEPLLAAGKK